METKKVREQVLTPVFVVWQSLPYSLTFSNMISSATCWFMRHCLLIKFHNPSLFERCICITDAFEVFVCLCLSLKAAVYYLSAFLVFHNLCFVKAKSMKFVDEDFCIIFCYLTCYDDTVEITM